MPKSGDAPAKAKGGRPSKARPGVFDRIADNYGLGLSLQACADAEGIAVETLHRWRNDNVGFATLLARARGVRIARYAGDLDERRDPSQMRWWLARMDAESFGDRKSVELTGANGGPIAVLAGVVDLSAEIRANPAAFREHAAILARGSRVREHVTSGVGDDGDGQDARALASSAAPVAPQRRTRPNRTGNT